MTPARHASVLALGGLLLALLLAAVFRGQLAKPLIVRGLRRALGVEATIAQVRGSILADVDLRGVQVPAPAAGGALGSFEAERVSARCSLAALLRGTPAFLESLEVTVAGARLDFDLGLARPPAAGSPPRAPGFPTLPRLTVRDSRLRVRGPGYEIEAGGVQATWRGRAGSASSPWSCGPRGSRCGTTRCARACTLWRSADASRRRVSRWSRPRSTASRSWSASASTSASAPGTSTCSSPSASGRGRSMPG